MAKVTNLIGIKFGRLTVVGRAPNAKDGRVRWNCLCSCGNTTITCTSNLNSGNSNSCGCLCRERTGDSRRTHGKTKTPEYKAWCDIKNRCTNQKSDDFKWYGARGIVVDPAWINDFQSFLEYVGNRPTAKHTIDRINVNGNYAPGNVRWSTQKEQQNNRRNNHALTLHGETKTIAQWEDALEVKRGTIQARISTYGYSAEKAVSEPVHYFHGNKYHKPSSS